MEKIKKDLVVPEKIQKKWASLINDLAVFLNVDMTFITKIQEDVLELVIVNHSSKHGYKGGEVFDIHGHYCEETIKGNSYHLVANYLDDPTKTDEEKAKKKLLSYLGFPLRWPNQKIYGTICGANHNPTQFTETQIKFLRHFQELVEAQLELIYQNNDLETMYRNLKESQEKIELYEKIVPMCSVCRKVRVNDGDWRVLEDFISASTGKHVSHSYCPTCYAKAIQNL